MLKKIVLGLFEGALLGGAVFFALLRLHAGWSPVVAYAAATLVGALVGAIAGKPIWGREAKLEGLLKTLAGAFIAMTAMYGTRKWLSGVQVNLESLGGGAGPIGQVPGAALPIIGASLGFVFQVDDALGGDGEPPPQRVLAPSAPAELADDDEDEAGSERRAHGER
jgi:hypothetical protein